MRKFFPKRRSTFRKRFASKRRVAFVRKTFRKGYKPRTALKRPRYTRPKTAVRKLHPKPNADFVRKVREAVLNKNVFDKTQSVCFTGASNQAMYNDLLPRLYEKAHLQYVNTTIPVINGGVGGNTADDPFTNKFTIHTNMITYSITNNSTVFCDTEAYFCRPRHDISGSSYAAPGGAVIQGFTDEVAAGGTTVGPSQLPWQSQLFTTWWHVDRVKKMRIGPGETVQLRLKHVLAKDFNMEHISPRNNATEVLAFTFQRCIMLRTLGGPCVDSSNLAVSTYSKPALSIIARTQMEWSVTPTYNKSVKTFNTIPDVSDTNQQHVSTGYNGVFPVAYAQ